ncbi:MAG TPA: NUDIX domain-containing protein [Candidatus Pacebacteria bacterium]|nr:NUDIX domain-containing protein [Candidatus Paceibacterota bacterium]
MKKVTYEDINGDTGEVDVDKLYFRPSVYGVLIEDSKILLSKQWDGYDFPGGGIDIHETIEEGLMREFWEETGLKIKSGKVVACETSFFKLPHVDDEYCNSILMYYLCKRVSGELSIENFDEHEKGYADMPEWISLDDLEKIKFYNSIDSIKIIKEAIKIIK